MERSLFEQVRNACKAVTERATHVQINYDRIPSYAASLPLHHATLSTLDPHCHYPGHSDNTIAFLLTLDAINFGSGYFLHLHKRPVLSGYFTVAVSLNDYYKERGPLSAQALMRLTTEDCTRTVFY